MSKIKLTMPTEYLFEVLLPIRICDLNYGNHLGVDGLLTLIHEARFQFFRSLNFTETEIVGTYISVMDTVLSYQGESFYGDSLHIRIGIGERGKCQCDLYYEVTSKRPIAHLKTTLVFRSHETNRPCAIPEQFLEKIR